MFFLSCGSQEPTAPSHPALETGIWEETYEWHDWGGISYTGDPDPYYPGFLRTSSLNFFDHQFSLTILPPIYKTVFEPDTVYRIPSSDTLYTGTYGIRGDTLILSVDSRDRPSRFHFRIENDSLYIRTAGEIDSLGNVAISLSSFLWDQSFAKQSGVFARVE
jgi:hypothetical protein